MKQNPRCANYVIIDVIVADVIIDVIVDNVITMECGRGQICKLGSVGRAQVVTLLLSTNQNLDS